MGWGHGGRGGGACQPGSSGATVAEAAVAARVAQVGECWRWWRGKGGVTFTNASLQGEGARARAAIMAGVVRQGSLQIGYFVYCKLLKQIRGKIQL